MQSRDRDHHQMIVLCQETTNTRALLEFSDQPTLWILALSTGFWSLDYWTMSVVYKHHPIIHSNIE